MIVVINRKIAKFVIIIIVLTLIIGFILLKGTKTNMVSNYGTMY